MTITPKTLAIYYGWPSAVNGSATIGDAANVFGAYNTVIFGSGLQTASHPDHANVLAIIAHANMASTEVYGYVDATLGYTALFQAVDDWIAMGVVGIFFDQFGYDFNVTRDRQNCLVEYVRFKGKKSFVNAWVVDDVFDPAVHATGNPHGVAATIDGNDTYLSESHYVVLGEYQTEAVWKAKSDKMAAHKVTFGTKMASTTTWDSRAFDQDKWDAAFYAAVLYDMDMCAHGEEFFSSSSASLPFRNRKEIYGDQFTGPIVQNGNTFSRDTNVGVQLKTDTQEASHLID